MLQILHFNSNLTLFIADMLNKLKKTFQGINILEVFFEKYKYSDQQ
jgi:hypothetical protein